MRREWIVAFLLAALAVGVYWPVRNHDFVYYDDPQLIAENPKINQGLTWEGIVYAFTQPVVGNWHPVTALSHMLDCEFFDTNPGQHHLINVVIHALNAAALFLLLRGLTGATWRSALAAALFALHPLRVESVAWISERKDVLSGFFFLLTLWAYAAWVKGREPSDEGRGTNTGSSNHTLNQPRPLDPRPSTLYYLLALFCFALGLMSKPMLVTLPFVLLLLDFWPLRRLQSVYGPAGRQESGKSMSQVIRTLVKEKVPFFALALACSVITVLVQRSAGAMSFFHHLTLGDRLANAAVSYARYLGKMIWPGKLAVIYPHPACDYWLSDRWPAWQIAAVAMLLVLISVLCLLRLSRQPFLAVGWFWYLGMMVPVIGLIQVGEQAMADRYTYLPLIGPVICLIWGVWDLAAAGGRPTTTPRPDRGAEAQPARPVLTCLSCATLLAIAGLTWLTHRQISYWRNTVTLFDHAVAVTADNPSAQFALGLGLEKEGQIRWAMVQYRVALAIDPAYAKADYNLGQLFSKAGDTRLAAVHFERALRSNPNDAASRLNLANCLHRLGRAKEAVAHYEEALRRNPRSTEGLNNLAWLLATDPHSALRNGERAVQLSERACELSDYRLPLMIGTLAAAYAEAGRFTDAIATAEKACAVATAAGEPAVAARNRELIELYRSGRPYHEPE